MHAGIHYNRKKFLSRLIWLGLLVGLLTACGVGTYEEPPHLKSIDISSEHTSQSLNIGQQIQLTATGLYSDKLERDVTRKITWHTSDEKIAAIDTTGLLKALSPGEVTITALSAKNSTTIKAAIEFVVSPTLMSISIEADDQVLEENSIPLKVIGKYNNDTSAEITDVVSWKASKKELVEFTDENQLKALQTGTVVITASYESNSATKEIEITPLYERISASQNATDFHPGEILSVDITAHTVEQEQIDATRYTNWEIVSTNTLQATDADNHFLVIAAGDIVLHASYKGRTVEILGKAHDPFNMYLIAAEKTSLTLGWNDQGADSYKVYWATSPVVDDTSNSITVDTNSFKHDNLDPDLNYYYRLASIKDGESPTLSNETFQFRILKDSWRQTIDRPGSYIQSPAVVKLGDSIHLIGGHVGADSGTLTARHEVFTKAGDGIAISQYSDLNTPVTEATACAYNDSIYLFGGRVGATSFSKSIQIYDSVSDTWSTFNQSLVSARAGAACAVIADKIYIAGGENDVDGVLDTIEVLDIGNGTITQLNDTLPTKTRSFFMFAANNLLFFVGGSNGIVNYDTLTSYDPANGGWDSTLAPMTEPRSSFTATLYNNELIVFGGFNDKGVLKTAEKYSLANDSWSPMPSLSSPRMFTASVVLGDMNYIVGGMGINGEQYSWIQLYNLTRNDVYPKAQLTESRWYYATGTVDDKLYVFGGVGNKNSSFFTLEIYDSNTNEWTQSDSFATQERTDSFVVRGITSLSYDGKIYTFGGASAYSYVSKLVEVYDPDSDKWSALDSLPSQREFSAACALEQKIYLFGGLNSSGETTNTLFEYDITTKKWKELNRMPTKHAKHRCEVIGDEIYIIGGTDESGKKTSDIVEIYSPISGQWKTVEPMQQSRRLFASTLINGEIFVFGGNHYDEVEQKFVDIASVEKFSPQNGKWTFQQDMPTKNYDLHAENINGQTHLIGGFDSNNQPLHDIRIYH